MAFCGAGPIYTAAGLKGDCLTSLITIVPHTVLLLAVGPNILFKWFKLRTPCDVTASKSWVRLSGHSLRWVISTLLLYVQVMQVMEGVLFDVAHAGLYLHLYVPHCIAILGTVFSLFFYNFVETYNLPRFLIFLLVYWLSIILVNTLKLVALYSNDLHGGHIRVSLAFLALSITSLIACIELYLFKKMFEKSPVNVRIPAPELAYVTYVHPYTSLLSRTTLHWLNSILTLGYRKPLELHDLGLIPRTEHSQVNYHLFKTVFEEERLKSLKRGKKPSLWRSYWRTYWPMLLLGGFYKFWADLLIFVGPICLDWIVVYVVEETKEKHANATSSHNQGMDDVHYMTGGEFFSNGYVLAMVTLGATLLQGALMQNNFYLCVRQGIRLKGALQALVFDKTLRLSAWSMGEGKLSQGTVMNHMAIDPHFLFNLFYFGHFCWGMPLQVFVTFCLLYYQLGVTALISAFILLFLVPFQYYIGQHLALEQKKALEQADVRLKKCNELLSTIKLLKLYAWEAIFQQSIEETRWKELRFLLRSACFRILSITITDGSPLLACIITFGVYPYIEKKPLQANKVFSALALFNILGLPLYLVTLIINIITHAKVSTDRLLPFLLAPEVEGASHHDEPSEPSGVNKKSKRKKSKSRDAAEVPSVKFDNPQEIPTITIMDFDDRAPVSAQASPSSQPLLNEDGAPGPPSNGKLPQDDHHTNGTVNTDLNNVANGTIAKETDGDDASSDVPSSEDETAPVKVNEVPLTNQISDDAVAVAIENGYFAWDESGKEDCLKEISVKIPKGELTLIVGPVGSGKSSLLAAMLGEMMTVAGRVNWDSQLRVAFGAQKAWLINASLQDNILFGSTMDIQRYERILDVCAMRPDIAMLPAGDKTEIGEKGINLSGGQKQRISIARALYSNKDVIVLDDALSALDVHVGTHIFEDAVMGYAKERNCTVIMVTHQLQHLEKAHLVIVMKEGRIIHQGSVEDIRKMAPELFNTSRLNEKGALFANKPETGNKLRPRKLVPPSISQLQMEHMQPSRSMLSLNSVFSMQDDIQMVSMASGTTKHSLDTPDEELHPDEHGRLIEEEERGVGSVSGRVYMTYVRAATCTLSILMCAGYSLRQAVRMGTDFWLAEWSEHAKQDEDIRQQYAAALAQFNGTNNATLPTMAPSNFDLEYYVVWYAVMCSIGMVLGLFSIIFLELMCITAARNLYKKMLHAVVRAPMRFFDTTPLGRIVNRMAGDTNIIDEKMPVTVDGVTFTVLYVVGGLLLNAVATPFFLIPAIPMILTYFFIQRFYIASTRELQRLDSITKSPILAHFSETLGGLSTIRAYKDHHRFKEQNWKNIDKNNTAFLYLHTANVWMGIRLDFVGAFTVFAAAVCSITSGLYGYATPGIVGLAIAYAINISGFINWMMRVMSEAEMYFTSIERVSHFTHIKPELQYHEQEVAVEDSWPAEGEIQFECVSLRYDVTLDPVITDLYLHINAGEKVGICGRTGSGKSSLTLGLFRMIDVCQGQIFIDGVDISKVPLSTLRSRISIIPQDPSLFEGTVRFNVDPEGVKSDAEVWHALEMAQLKILIKSLPEQLLSSITEGGENFSLGQRQLFCVARAILRDSHILVMDEATASIDMKTDAILQQVIREAFLEKTVITIAHRVGTILHCDSIIVLQDGIIVEHDSPQNLLEQEGIFASMVHSNK